MSNPRRVVPAKAETGTAEAQGVENAAADKDADTANAEKALSDAVTKAAAEASSRETENVTTEKGAEQSDSLDKAVSEVNDEVAKAAAERAKRDLESALAAAPSADASQSEQNEADEPEEFFMFVATYPQLHVYITLADRTVPIHFRNGSFKTSDRRVAEALIKLPACGSLFRRIDDAAAFALRAQAEQRRSSLHKATSHGSTSADENHQRYAQQEAALNEVVKGLF